MKISAQLIMRGLFLVAVVGLSGCASMQPMSNYARTGDTVAISLGGEHIRALVPVLKKEKIDVSITDSSGAVYPVTLRSLFKLQADLASRLNTSGLIQGSFDYSEGAYQGVWMAICDLVDPVTGSAPPLAVGMASLNVDAQSQINDVNSGSAKGDIRNIPIEILPGQGSLNPLNEYATFGGGSVRPIESLEPLQQIDISPSGPASFGGASYELSYTTGTFGLQYFPRAVPATQDPNVQVISDRIDQGDGTTILKIFVLNPKGFRSNNGHQGLASGASDLRSLSVRLVWTTGNVNDTNWQQSIQMINSKYINNNGDPITTVSPLLTKVR